jgi:bifunctional UDP-N-acetylglucosamine pyrophosphorylase/glucosamine-1-phosphate N-acetyltransferase
MTRVLIVPAAGRGSRLGSELPKVMVPVNRRPMIDYLFDRYRDLVSRFLLVVSPAAHDSVARHCESRPEQIDLLLQETPTGMLDAILIPRERVAEIPADEVWVTWCDQVAVTAASVHRLAQLMAAEPRPALGFPTVENENPYIHFRRDQAGRITEVLHRREEDTMPERGEGDIGLFALSRAAYLTELPSYASQASLGGRTGERNFLPFIPWLARTARVSTVPASSAMEAVGIKTPDELERVSRHLAQFHD